MLSCEICKKELVGKQRKFCSTSCKNKSTNNRLQKYSTQKGRGLLRKRAAIGRLGGCCSLCGYNKNTAALEFHHLHSKLFCLNMQTFSNMSEESLNKEIAKCVLLCANCHAETHYPDYLVEWLWEDEILEN